MAEIKIKIVAEITRHRDTITLDLTQTHQITGHVATLRHDVDSALLRGVDQVRDMYGASRRAVTRG